MDGLVLEIKRTAVGAVCLAMLSGAGAVVRAQQGFFSKDDVIKYTADWKGERFPDGRPKVPDSILDRMQKVTLEEAWATLDRKSVV